MALRRLVSIASPRLGGTLSLRSLSLTATLRSGSSKSSSAAASAVGADWELFAARAAGAVHKDDKDAEALEVGHLRWSTRGMAAGPAMALAAALPFTSVNVADAATTVAMAASEAAALNPALATFLSVFPPLCFGFLQVSGLKTVKEIQKKKSTGDLSPLPFVSLATNCVVWICYGALRQDMTVLLPNLSGAAFGLYYTYQFYKYSATPITNYLAGSAAIMSAALAMAATLPAADAAHYIGLTGCALAVILMASPLATLKTVIATRNTSAMPFVTSLATLFNASAWTGYGVLVAHDPIVWGPNALGLVAAGVQMALFAKYGIHTAPPASGTKTDSKV